MSVTKTTVLLASLAAIASAQSGYEVAEFNAILVDVQAHLQEYMSLAMNNADFTIPSGVLEVYEQLTTYTDETYTTLFSAINFAQVTTVMEQVPWYSSRLIPIISSYMEAHSITETDGASSVVATSAAASSIVSSSAAASSSSGAVSSSSSAADSSSLSASSASSSSAASSSSSAASSSSSAASSSSSSSASASSTAASNGTSSSSANAGAALNMGMFSAGMGAAIAGAAALLL
ncbi:SRP1/TIP1 family protein NDAI_0H01300 [Naumovozyma dairenensis CBS 421]|uniref:Temperature shock-inducible protein 1 n=1 Tax=Naumovozyma dairenensis (strain ATCC 10597 / BCRC 20456 / CBS 421 / NBRC 0211 / NRRL Y-12639) TaxID=1071378 RepID=G0WEU3_NAUDC|nr:hypothetical protein NDAI_0H01300 [Naumovozyma dairenensis CBS 421]CCD26304.1 hypothetical protein NDAI_0H01300 [Naumovozyma dairenensis CBS 421]